MIAHALRLGPKRRRELLGELTGWLFALPWFAGFLIFTAMPMLASALISVTDWNFIAAPRFVGLDNWRMVLVGDPLVLHSLRVTAMFAMTSVPLQAIFSLLIALLLNQPIKGLRFFRTVFYLPSVVSGVALAMLYRWLLSPDLGLINYTLALVGIRGPAWLLDPFWALPALVFTTLWGVGGMVVIYLAALQGVPTQLYEAAEVDGARAWNKLWSITLPMISPAIFFQIVMGLIAAFQQFVFAQVLTAGGPNNATLFSVLYLYRVAFEQFRMGFAAAIAWLLFFVILVVTLLVFRIGRVWVYYEGMLE
jgi:multiple sugar transport system permease protein